MASVLIIDSDNQIHKIDTAGNYGSIVGPTNGAPRMIAANAGGIIWLAAIDKTPNSPTEDYSILYFSSDSGATWHKPGGKNLPSGFKIAVTNRGSCLFIDDKNGLSEVQQNGTVTKVLSERAMDMTINPNGDVYYVSTEMYPVNKPEGTLIKSFPLSNPSAAGPYVGHAIGTSVAAANNSAGFYLIGQKEMVSVVFNSGQILPIAAPFRSAQSIAISPKSGDLWAIGLTDKGQNALYYLGGGASTFVRLALDSDAMAIGGYE